MVVANYRPTKAIIHTQAIQENVANERKRLPKETELFAVVKANGYGHGAVETAKAALRGGATGFCVAALDEGIELREAGLTEPILVLSIVEPMYSELALSYDLAVTVGTQEGLEEISKVMAHSEVEGLLKIHLKADTGMGRIGFLSSEEMNEAIQTMERSKKLLWEGLFTHFSTADQSDDTYWQHQLERFTEILQGLPKKPRYIHTSNSATALWHDAGIGNMVRYGVAMYGLNPSGNVLEAPYPLKPALELVSSLIQVKKLPKGEGIGYGETYITPEAEWIGTVPIGYADGWLRKMQGFHLLVQGEPCEIVGRVCMDQLMIRLPKEYSIGTKVTLIGANNGKSITMQEVADHLETIHYEVACTLSARVPRNYEK
ncbi:alanine racemase [Enterococcus phoeniculicola]|jgi:alanine racemase|uniref:Alanine racemase n=1 Tax=Enterococcus phoeniculicola ATCC BAA-412 TaxID=1158610 RepID=R3W4T1_9ENTE|nr:alanine racemase [Enterococcus phoeniculicola]EOL42627.1 alanine racemase [Enterococcus phoeniculicola ATCC BAA-412]EOT79089.1 alanine racemase [Enterococcus phoeniculicola ATCC BAA-412]OJG72367.1 alanine racemase [Enterococcus phoeniculicola]